MVVFIGRAGMPGRTWTGYKNCFRTLHDAAPATIAHPTRKSKLLFRNFDVLDARLRRTTGKGQAQPFSRRDLLRRAHDLAARFLDNAVAAFQDRLRIEVRQARLHFDESGIMLIEQASCAALQAQPQLLLSRDMRVDALARMNQALSQEIEVLHAFIERAVD